MTHSRLWIAGAGAVAAATLAACLSPAGHAGGATAPLLNGRYRTSVRILVDTNNPRLPTGYTAVRTWSFVPSCSAAGCSTTLYRPSIFPGRTTVFRYVLHLVSSSTYRGTLDVPDRCLEPTRALPWGSVVDRQVMTIRPTRTSAGKVVAFEGTMVTTTRPTKWAKAQGCTAAGYQKAAVRSPA